MNRILLFVLLSLALNSCKTFQEIVIKDKQQWRADGLSVTEKIISQEDFPKNAATAIFIPAQTISQAVKGFSGTKIKSVKQFKNWGVVVDSVITNPENGVFLVKLYSHILDPKERRKLRLDLEAQLNISGIYKNDSSIFLKYELLPMAIDPHIKVFGLSVHSKRTARVLADLSAMWLHSENKLSFEDSIPRIFTQSLSNFFPIDSTYRLNPNKDEKDWFIDLNYKMKDMTLNRYLCLNAPAFIKSGVWLSFNLVENSTPCELEKPQDQNVLGYELEKRNNEVDSKINKIVRDKGLAKESNYFWLNQNVIGKLITDINNIPSEGRKILLKSTKKSGNLFEDKWSDNLLGKGGVKLLFTDNNAISGDVQIKNVQSNWNSNSGINFSIGLSTTINVDVKLHVDPLIGGGIGTKVGLKAETEGKISGSVGFKIGNYNNHTVLIAVPKVNCNSMNVKVLTDPSFKTDYGWTKIPQFGATIPLQVAKESLPVFPILNSIPKVVRYQNEIISVSKKDTIVKDTIIIRTANKFLTYTTTPKSINIDEKGIEVLLETSLEFSNDSSQFVTYSTDEKQLKDLFKAMKTTSENCEENGLVVHMGKIEIGPNNEIVKFLNDSWNDIVNGPGDKNEVVLLIDRIGDLINENTPLDDIAYNFFNEATAFSEKVLGKDNDLTKTLQSTVNELEKFKKTPGKAVGDIPSNVINEGKNVIKKGKKALKKVGKKIAKALGW